jgi:hypothetical protein
VPGVGARLIAISGSVEVLCLFAYIALYGLGSGFCLGDPLTQLFIDAAKFSVLDPQRFVVDIGGDELLCQRLGRYAWDVTAAARHGVLAGRRWIAIRPRDSGSEARRRMQSRRLLAMM